MLYTPQDLNYVRRVQDSFARQAFMQLIQAELRTIEPGYCEIHLPYQVQLTQQHQFFHAGIVATLADNAAGYAAFTLMAAQSSILSVEFKLNLVSPADGEWLIARAEVLKHGKTLSVCRSDIFIVKNGTEKLCAAAQCTLIELPNTNDSAG
ncbi:MAG: PaaI family thioesterase [Bacteroidia bacterium]